MSYPYRGNAELTELAPYINHYSELWFHPVPLYSDDVQRETRARFVLFMAYTSSSCFPQWFYAFLLQDLRRSGLEAVYFNVETGSSTLSTYITIRCKHFFSPPLLSSLIGPFKGRGAEIFREFVFKKLFLGHLNQLYCTTAT